MSWEQGSCFARFTLAAARRRGWRGLRESRGQKATIVIPEEDEGGLVILVAAELGRASRELATPWNGQGCIHQGDTE